MFLFYETGQRRSYGWEPKRWLSEVKPAMGKHASILMLANDNNDSVHFSSDKVSQTAYYAEMQQFIRSSALPYVHVTTGKAGSGWLDSEQLQQLKNAFHSLVLRCLEMQAQYPPEVLDDE